MIRGAWPWVGTPLRPERCYLLAVLVTGTAGFGALAAVAYGPSWEGFLLAGFATLAVLDALYLLLLGMVREAYGT